MEKWYFELVEEAMPLFNLWYWGEKMHRNPMLLFILKQIPD